MQDRCRETQRAVGLEASARDDDELRRAGGRVGGPCREVGEHPRAVAARRIPEQDEDALAHEVEQGERTRSRSSSSISGAGRPTAGPSAPTGRRGSRAARDRVGEQRPDGVGADGGAPPTVPSASTRTAAGAGERRTRSATAPSAARSTFVIPCSRMRARVVLLRRRRSARPSRPGRDRAARGRSTGSSAWTGRPASVKSRRTGRPCARSASSVIRSPCRPPRVKPGARCRRPGPQAVVGGRSASSTVTRRRSATFWRTRIRCEERPPHPEQHAGDERDVRGRRGRRGRTRVLRTRDHDERGDARERALRAALPQPAGAAFNPPKQRHGGRSPRTRFTTSPRRRSGGGRPRQRADPRGRGEHERRRDTSSAPARATPNGATSGAGRRSRASRGPTPRGRPASRRRRQEDGDQNSRAMSSAASMPRSKLAPTTRARNQLAGSRRRVFAGLLRFRQRWPPARARARARAPRRSSSPGGTTSARGRPRGRRRGRAGCARAGSRRSARPRGPRAPSA